MFLTIASPAGPTHMPLLAGHLRSLRLAPSCLICCFIKLPSSFRSCSMSWRSHTQAAISQLGERPKEEAQAQAWDMHYNAVDATAHDAAAREYPDAETQNAWERYLHREQLLVLRDQLIQYGGAHAC